MSDINPVTDAGLLQFAACIAFASAAVCWLGVALTGGRPALQSRLNIAAALFAAMASGLMAGSLFS